jgi:anthrone oxygenase-like protein
MSESTIVKVVRGASLLFTGLFAGFLLGVLVLENSLRGYGAAVYTQVRQVELDSLDKLASATLIPALVCTVIVAVATIRARGNDRWLVLVAVGLLALVFVTSLAVNLPINGDQADWSVQAPPSDWASVRDRWQLAHTVRTISAVLAFSSLIGATLTRPARRRTSVGARRIPVGS